MAAAISLGTSLAIILTTIVVYLTPAARHHLDRISFRLLFCIMILECGYDIAWIGLFHDVCCLGLFPLPLASEGEPLASCRLTDIQWPTFTPPQHACAIGMFSLFGTMAS